MGCFRRTKTGEEEMIGLNSFLILAIAYLLKIIEIISDLQFILMSGISLLLLSLEHILDSKKRIYRNKKVEK